MMESPMIPTMQLNHAPGKQQGATLMVALILLVLISLLGITSLKSASVVEKMSSNDYQKNITFQASESAVSATLANGLEQAASTGVPVPMTDVDINMQNVRADVTYTPIAGSAAVLGTGFNVAGGIRVMVTSTGTLTSNPAIRTRTVHGYIRTAPAINP